MDDKSVIDSGRSTVSSHHIRRIDLDDVRNEIKTCGNGFQESTIKDSLKFKIGQIKDSVFISPLILGELGSEEELGQKIYERTLAMLDIMGSAFRVAVEQNFDFFTEKQVTNARREVHITEKSKLESIIKSEVHDPKKAEYDMLQEADLILYEEDLEKGKEEYMSKIGKGNEKTLSDASRKTKRKDNESADGSSIDGEDMWRREKDTLLAAKHEELRKQYVKEYAKAYKDSNDLRQKKNSAIKELCVIEDALKGLNVYAISLDMFELACGAVSLKILTAVEGRQDIKDKLKGNITIFDEEICNPFDSQNLPGMLFILRNEYYRLSFLSFSTQFLNVLEFELDEKNTNAHPEKAVLYFQKQYALWKSRNLWAMMREDVFFSTLLVRSLHTSAVKNEVVRKLKTEMEKYEAAMNEDGDESTLKPMALFKSLADTIKTHEQYKKQVPEMHVRDSTGANRTKKSGTPSTAGTERAAAATITPPKATGAKFEGEVQKTENHMITIKGKFGQRSVPYIAVAKKSDICQRCYPDSGSATNPCERPCRLFSCNKCQLYGHLSSNCLQKKTADGAGSN